ncbi:MAG: ABC transporter ATP-binding protein [Anaerolineae bacterium]|jgi:simple sugar transport system ATP-binding protein|nr:ABC transporter ATP-binding protein [Anaerolineae bacterium]MBT3714819.1 ABC transporter ATP-binding protein [Anaerolineae bacterium]MBT4310867.1 ABC transporter ATP-binding protein [Anaerolineae bacterium]MBT4459548.1 ABC transporter ATP-binding protein [Anaerolineae bacterium]MBT4841870.1 ABC transporter ATP-binding protein [Anaerolineae bacterium]
MNYHVELREIVKRFPGVLANDHVNLAIERGEIRALVGENGAGKSTLMNIIYGLYQPDEGAIFLDGQPLSFSSPLDSIAAGIGMVHQHFMLFPSLTVTENVIYGSEPTKKTLIDRKMGKQRVLELSEAYNLQVDPDRKVADLPVGIQQRVEILKALYRRADLLILDEPTAVLTPQEKDGLFDILHRLIEEKKTIIFITHKLQEVMEISDTATVLRGGKVTANLDTADTSPEEICSHMVGRKVLLRVEKKLSQPAETVLAVENLSVNDNRGVSVLRDVSLSVRAGEIVGIAGVAGNGQEELIQALSGLNMPKSGSVRLSGKNITNDSVAEHRAKGMSYIPEDRTGLGLALDASVVDNFSLGFQRKHLLSSSGFLRMGVLQERTVKAVRDFGIKTANVNDAVATLSGGNMQKVVLAREFLHESPLIIAEQPTRGVDVAAIENIHSNLIAQRDEGRAILLISADLNEILGLADRIYVIFDGSIVGEMLASEATEYDLGLLMTGVTNEDGAIGDVIRGKTNG